jgi:glycosyltransferase involved in cell wall biosynthesis
MAGCGVEEVEEITADALIAIARRAPLRPPRCSVIVPSVGDGASLSAVLGAVAAGRPGVETEIVVVDDSPLTDRGAAAAALASVRPDLEAVGLACVLVRGTRAGYAAAANMGIRAATGDVVVLLHDDVVVQPGTIQLLLEHLDATGAGAAGPRLLDDRGCSGGAGLAIGPDLLPYPLYRHHAGDAPEVCRTQTVTALSSACFVAPRLDLVGAGGFDEGLSMFEDADLCLRLWGRHRPAWYVADAVVRHRGHGTPGARHHLADAAYFTRKWEGRLVVDDERRAAADGLPLSRIRVRSWYLPRPGRTPIDEMAPPSVLWSGLFFDRSGYANEARTYLFALRDAGVAAFANPYRWPPPRVVIGGGRDEQLDACATEELPRRFVHVCHLPAMAVQRHPAAVANVARTMWETDRLPDERAESVASMDEIWVPKPQNVEVFAAAGIDRRRIHIIPAAIDDELYGTLLPRRQIEGAHGFVFLSLFAWSRRKGWDVLVRAYVEEFGPGEDVTLVLAVSPSPGQPIERSQAQLEDYLHNELGRSLAGCPRIVWLPLENVPPHEVAHVYRGADAYVMPTRGEGAALPISEAMASALPVIVTRDCVSYVDDRTAFLVDHSWSDIEEWGWNEFPAFRGHRWAEPDRQQVRDAMRRVIDDRDEAHRRAAAGREHVLAHLAKPVVAAQVIERLQALVSE